MKTALFLILVAVAIICCSSSPVPDEGKDLQCDLPHKTECRLIVKILLILWLFYLDIWVFDISELNE